QHSTYFSLVYGLHTINTRKSPWKDLASLTVDNPWIIMGNFNIVLNSQDIVNRAPISNYKTQNLVSFVDTISICEVHSSSSYYSWSIKRHGNTRIVIRINKCFANGAWFLLYDHIKSLYFALDVSDRSPLLVEFLSQCSGGGRPFRFLIKLKEVKEDKKLHFSKFTDMMLKTFLLRTLCMRFMIARLKTSLIILALSNYAHDFLSDLSLIESEIINFYRALLEIMHPKIDLALATINDHKAPRIDGLKLGFLRRLRIGEPLSPFLSAIGIEYLSRRLAELSSNINFSYHPRCERAFLKFSFASGLSANLDKSSVYFSGFDSSLQITMGFPLSSKKLIGAGGSVRRLVWCVEQLRINLMYAKLRPMVPKVKWRSTYCNNPAKHKSVFVTCLAILYRISTKDRLLLWNVPCDTLCVFVAIAILSLAIELHWVLQRCMRTDGKSRLVVLLFSETIHYLWLLSNDTIYNDPTKSAT
ncbi:Formamidopyrimidine-DNA glycosylase, partial [Bienertia sinuspersici]